MSKSKPGKTPARKGTFLIAGLILLAIVLAAIVVFNDRPVAQAALPSQVSVDQAAQLREQGVFVLDVRQPEEWNEAHIPGSTLIPLGELPQRLSELPSDQEILVVCRSGNRSQTGRDILREAGFENVTSMSGGIISWNSKGYPTVSGP